MNKALLLKGFLGISIFYLLLIVTDNDAVAWFIKPFLLPFLILYVYSQESFFVKKFLLIALTFSWIGDVVLLFANQGEFYFIMGLLCFLTAHVFYCVLFSKLGISSAHKKSAVFWLGFIMVVFYLRGLLIVLLPKLGDLKLPVGVYSLVLSLMLLFAWRGYFTWKKPASLFLLFGAMAFVASDSLLAVNKFYEPIANASFLIMITYLVAQFGIVFGVVSFKNG
ncbi:MAG: hypothetical protein RL308_2599 [Bacteroidota bacterium]|jgi:uncharacterized membrane protein YhhN